MISDMKIINNPSPACRALFLRKLHPREAEQVKGMAFTAIGLIQANVASILYYADVVSKASEVYPVEIQGNCPTTMTVLAFFGDISSVKTAMAAAERERDRERQEGGR